MSHCVMVLSIGREGLGRSGRGRAEAIGQTFRGHTVD
jgi:hypothetical protein